MGVKIIGEKLLGNKVFLEIINDFRGNSIFINGEEVWEVIYYIDSMRFLRWVFRDIIVIL